MRALIEGMNAHIDPRADLAKFYDYVWNVETAQGFGLDIWGRIVGIGRELTISAPNYFGFNEALPDSYPFAEQPFFAEQPATSTYLMADDGYRKLILVKALVNISATTAAAINQLLQNLFSDRGRCYVNDLGGMAMRYTFEFLLSDVEYAIVTQSGALPRPAGVQSTMIAVELPTFGFAADSAPFGQAPFMSEGAIHAII